MTTTHLLAASFLEDPKPYVPIILAALAFVWWLLNGNARRKILIEKNRRILELLNQQATERHRAADERANRAALEQTRQAKTIERHLLVSGASNPRFCPTCGQDAGSNRTCATCIRLVTDLIVPEVGS